MQEADLDSFLLKLTYVGARTRWDPTTMVFCTPNARRDITPFFLFENTEKFSYSDDIEPYPTYVPIETRDAKAIIDSIATISEMRDPAFISRGSISIGLLGRTPRTTWIYERVLPDSMATLVLTKCHAAVRADEPQTTIEVFARRTGIELALAQPSKPENLGRAKK